MTEFNDGTVHERTATIDNGRFGTRTVRFETGRLARQAAGSVVAYLDDETMLLSATTASKHPKDHRVHAQSEVAISHLRVAQAALPGHQSPNHQHSHSEYAPSCSAPASPP